MKIVMAIIKPFKLEEVRDALTAIGGTSGLLEGNPQLLLIQIYGAAVTLAWSGAVTYILLKVVSAFVPLRVTLQQELEGLDISQHGEALQ